MSTNWPGSSLLPLMEYLFSLPFLKTAHNIKRYWSDMVAGVMCLCQAECLQSLYNNLSNLRTPWHSGEEHSSRFVVSAVFISQSTHKEGRTELHHIKFCCDHWTAVSCIMTYPRCQSCLGCKSWSCSGWRPESRSWSWGEVFNVYVHSFISRKQTTPTKLQSERKSYRLKPKPSFENHHVCSVELNY